MRKIIYYVATSIDGYICGINEDISGFVGAGSGVNKYLQDLASFDTVVMGRKTYEFGYKFGLKPGELPYPHMTHYIFSNNFKLENADEKIHILPIDIEEVRKIKEQEGSDIYLCGGGKFAGWLWDHEQIDLIKLKLNPLVLGEGVRLFGDSRKTTRMDLIDSESYEDGLQILSFCPRSKS